jgi:sulfur relay (sulfurtransferase) DsrF/TusC family protein
MKGAGADLAVLLRGNAVNYAALGQDAAGLSFGGWRQMQPPRLSDDISSLVAKGVAVYVLDEDLVERGLRPGDILNGVQRIGRDGLPQLLGGYDQIWHW